MNVNMTRTRAIVARLGESQWGWEWKNPDHINTLSDEAVIENLIILAEVVSSYNKAYSGIIERVRSAVDWREDMGK